METNYYTGHSMARANLNKSKKSLAFKGHTQEAQNLHQLKSQIYLVKVPLNVNIMTQDLLNSF